MKKKTTMYGLVGVHSGDNFYTTCYLSGLDIVINCKTHEDQFGRVYDPNKEPKK